MKAFHICGELLVTQHEIIMASLRVLFEEPCIRVKSLNDIIVEKDLISLNIYKYKNLPDGNKNFLIGGNVFNDLSLALEVFYGLAQSFDRMNIIYDIELDDKSEEKEIKTLKLSHRNFNEVIKRL